MVVVARLSCDGLLLLGVGVVEDGGRGLGAEVSVRWHSFRIEGMEEAGSSDAMGNAWILVKRLEAYGSCDVGPGTERGWIFG